MTRHKQQAARSTRPCFVGATVLGTSPVFNRPELCECLLDLWRSMHNAGRLTMFAYVLLEDRLMLAAAGDDFARQIGQFRTAAAAGLLERMQALGAHDLLKRMKRFQPQPSAGGDPAAQLWQGPGEFEWLNTSDALRQRIDEIHNFPVKRGYVLDPTLYRFSSARDYAGQPGPLPVLTDW